MPHTHGSAAAAHRGRLVAVFAISLTILVVEVVGSVVTNSLALLADAGHVLADVAGIGLALLAIWFAGRPATAGRTFGYLRLEILAAIANAVLLFGIAAFVLFEAWQRFNQPVEIATGADGRFALVGLRSATASRCCSSATRRRRASTCAAPTSRCSATSWDPRPSSSRRA